MNKISDLRFIPALFVSSTLKIVFTPKLLFLCLIPYLIGIIAFCGFSWTFFEYRHEIANLLFSYPAEWMETLASWIGFIFTIFISAFLALLVALALGGIFIEGVIEHVLQERGLLSEKPFSLSGFSVSIIRSLRDDLFRIICFTFLSILFFIFGLIPPLALLPLLFGLFTLGYNLIDLPLALLEIPFKKRLRLAKQVWLELLALGGIFALLLLIPLAGIIFLPIAYLVAVERLAVWNAKTDLLSLEKT